MPEITNIEWRSIIKVYGAKQAGEEERIVSGNVLAGAQVLYWRFAPLPVLSRGEGEFCFS